MPVCTVVHMHVHTCRPKARIPTPGAPAVYMVDPRDGEVIRSLVGLQRKLGLAPPAAPPLPPNGSGSAMASVDAVRLGEQGHALRRPPLPPADGGALPPLVTSTCTRRQRRELRPKAHAARIARRAMEEAEAEAQRAAVAAEAASQRLCALETAARRAVAAVEEAASAHAAAEKAVAAAIEAARLAAIERERSRAHLCLEDGCGQRFANRGALRRHQHRVHRTAHADEAGGNDRPAGGGRKATSGKRARRR